MEKAAKKLTLSKETLRTLNDDELTDVVGGQTGICVGGSIVCDSAVCDSAVCQSAVCHSAAVCQSALCQVGQSVACSIICAV